MKILLTNNKIYPMWSEHVEILVACVHRLFITARFFLVIVYLAMEL